MKLNSKDGSAGITVLLVVAIVVVLNFLVGGLGLGNARLDLTQNKLYTLTPGTFKILDRLSTDEPVTIRFYYTDSARVMLDDRLTTYSKTVKNLLLEVQKASKNRVVLESIVTNPKTEEEDRATEDDLQGMQANMQGDNIYLGIAIQCASRKEVLPFLNPAEETSLEYNVARAIKKVSSPSQPVVGVMSTMPVMGSPMFPFQRQQGQAPWVLVQRLRLDYDVREFTMNSPTITYEATENGSAVTKIPEVLVVIHPADITELGEYAIDQYLLKGGKVIAMVDPQNVVAERVYSNQQNPMTGQPGGVVNPVSDLPNLFKAWGVGYNKTTVVADVNYRTVMQGRANPVALHLPREALNSTDRLTADLQSLLMMTSGAFEVENKEGLSLTTLIESSEASDLVDSTSADRLMRENMAGFNPRGRKQKLAVRLTGKFKTAFPNGRPKVAASGPETGGAQDDATAPKTDAPAPAAATAAAPAAPASAPAPAPAPQEKPAAPAPAPAAATAAPSPAPAAAAEQPAAKPEAPKAEPAKVAQDEAKKADAPAKIAITDGTIMESSSSEGMVILFADADMLYDAFCVQQDGMGGLVATNSNLPLILNAVEMFSGGGDLLQVRSRASTRRPFTKLDEMREKVEREFRPKLQALQAQLDETVQKMGPLRMKNTGEIVANPAQLKELENLKDTQSKINKEIREIEKAQTKDMDFIESIITLLNVAGVPLLVIIVGILLAIRRRVSTAAV